MEESPRPLLGVKVGSLEGINRHTCHAGFKVFSPLAVPIPTPKKLPAGVTFLWPGAFLVGNEGLDQIGKTIGEHEIDVRGSVILTENAIRIASRTRKAFWGLDRD